MVRSVDSRLGMRGSPRGPRRQGTWPYREKGRSAGSLVRPCDVQPTSLGARTDELAAPWRSRNQRNAQPAVFLGVEASDGCDGSSRSCAG